MRIFNNFPQHEKCPICKTNENKESTLIAILGTKDSKNWKAQIFHISCIDLIFDKEENLILMKWKDEK